MAEGKLINLGHMMHRWGQLITATFRKEVEKDDTIATDRLHASIRPDIKIFGNSYTLEILMEDYWKSVDQGTKPGTKPDIQKILKWMRHKGIQPRPGKTNLLKPRSTKARKIFKDRRLVLAEKIANAIQRKGTIQRFGYKGTGFVTEQVSTLAERMRESILEATGRDIKIQILNVIK